MLEIYDMDNINVLCLLCVIIDSIISYVNKIDGRLDNFGDNEE